MTDGRDAWLSQIAYHAVQDALDAGGAPQTDRLATRVWQRFADSADLARPRHDGAAHYAFPDAVRKVRDKLRLAREGLLPARTRDAPEPDYEAPVLSASEGRAQLAESLSAFCAKVQAWHDGSEMSLPAKGIRATVGLGKSCVARNHLLALAESLRARSSPDRILVFTASHALAEETAASWTDAGARVAVLRGYERKDPDSGLPMCRDLETVRAALASAQSVRDSACSGKDGTRCRYFDGCLKQQNLRDIAAANVVVAPYDALFSGLAFERDDVALLMIDEGCWARSLEQLTGLFVEDIAQEPVSGMGGQHIGRGPVGAMADLIVFRSKVAKAMAAQGPGPITRSGLLDVCLTAADCRHAAQLERWRLQDVQLFPGMPASARKTSFAVAASNARTLLLAAHWQCLAELLDDSNDMSGNMSIAKPDSLGRHAVVLRRIRGLHESLRGKPILHLDATMRPDLLSRILPDLEVEQIDVAAPHMRVRMVRGSFGKSMVCPAPGLAADERTRRNNRLAECIDYVRWHARRVSPGRVLLVTYQAIEAAFDGIPNVEVAHFNAVAGLDCYRDVSLLISIGRPLPPSQDLEALSGAYFGAVPGGRYRHVVAGLRMSSGTVRGVVALRHEDEQAETLRATICDDELIQVVGRGRGVNRTEQNPLEVHILADVALPLVCDRLTTWDIESPDVVQRMLLAGIAVDSPADAAALHPGLFSGPNEAKLAFGRSAFKGQNPMSISYREMTLKSAAYRRGGRGRGWQRAWWIDRDAANAQGRLAAVLGPMSEWRPE